VTSPPVNSIEHPCLRIWRHSRGQIKYRNLPAHYPTLDEALDRVAYLKGKGFKARALALVATPTDTAAEFESAKIRPPE